MFLRPILLSLCLVPIGPAAFAGDIPQGTVSQDAASKGTTEVTSQKFEAAVVPEDLTKAKDATELSIGAGGLGSTGNSRLLSLTGNAQFRLRRSENQLSAAAAGNYGYTAPPGQSMQTSVENAQGKVRYDRFVLADLTVFLGVQARNDRFQGLDLRLQIDPGLGYYFVNDPKQLFWTEVGYDYLHDIRRNADRIVRDASGAPVFDPTTGAPQLLDKTKTVHSARIFLGYTNQLNEGVNLSVGLEYLQGLNDTEAHKLNGDLKLSSKIGTGFSLATTFSLRYDSEPLPGKVKLDTITALNLVYTLI